VIHPGTPVTDHVHEAATVTEIVPVRPVDAAEIVRGDTVDEHETPD
jgi:hypothetical protein